jgi:hypothetical protein
MGWGVERYGHHLALALAATLVAASAGAEELPRTLSTRPVALAEHVQNGDRLDRIRVRGMLELPSLRVAGLRFSQLSGLAWDDDDGVLYAISDKGALFHLEPQFQNGMLSGIRLLRAVPLREPGTTRPLKAARSDSEGLAILHGRNGRKGDAELLVSFERQPRITRYRPDGNAIGDVPLPAALTDVSAYEDPNKMLESVCTDPKLGVLTTPEAPLAGAHANETRIFATTGTSWRYPLGEENRISDLVCLGDGTVLVLHRDFGQLLGRNAAAIRRTTLPAGGRLDQPVTAETLLTLDAAEGHTLDNFEGLAQHQGNRFFLVSDDNDLFIQRTLLLYFELLDR